MVQIIHTPLGQEHPYQQLPQERFPRYPQAGQPFKGLGECSKYKMWHRYSHDDLLLFIE